LAGSARSTRAASVTPNASMSSGLALASGKCSRVADATPSSAWHPRHCAASKIGYTVRENESGGADCCAWTLREVSAPHAAATTAAATNNAQPVLLLTLAPWAE